MSAGRGFAAAVARVQGLALALKAVANGEAARAAQARVERLFTAIAESKLPTHHESGHAEGVVKARPDAWGIALDQPGYLRYQRRWWPFARGVGPVLLRRVAKIYQQELARLLSTSSSTPTNDAPSPGGEDSGAGPVKRKHRRKTT